jgi:arylsulfatase A-like enzyme
MKINSNLRIMKNKIILLLSVLALSFTNCNSPKTTANANKDVKSVSASKKPNILFILVDDFGWRDIAGTGSTFYETPNIDRLITQGTTCSQAYSSYPRCVPSRYSIMTGSYPARTATSGKDEGLHINVPNVSIGQAMKNSGYHTFYIGKWHLGGAEDIPSKKGFDQSVAAGGAGATASHFAPYNLDKTGKEPKKESPITDLDDAPVGECLEDRLSDETIKLLKQNANKSEPFFGILAQYAVHTPIQGKKEYIEYFKEKLKKNPQVGQDYEKESAGENKLKQDNVTYAALIKAVDDGIGKIMKTLDELGIAENTIIVLTSDHGGLSSRGNTREVATTNRPLRAGKGHLYEGGIRVPLIVKWAGVAKAGSICDAPILGTDHLATMVEIGGGTVPQTQVNDGQSYASILKGGNFDPNRPLYWHNWAPRPTSTGDNFSSAIRVGDYKLVDLFTEKKQELYNLKTDIGEARDIAATNPEITKKLYAQLQKWRSDVGISMEGIEKLEKKMDKKTERKEEKKAERKEQRKAGKTKEN